MRSIVYKITNNINSMIYIGIHRCRHFRCEYLGSGKLIKAAITRNGSNNFSIEILS